VTGPPSCIDDETKIDILQRRVNNKANRILRVIQINIIVLSLVASIIQFSPLSISPNKLILIGSLGVITSIAISIFGIGTKTAHIDFSSEELMSDISRIYNKRLRVLSRVLISSVIFSSFGLLFILFGSVRGTGLDSVFPYCFQVVIAISFALISLLGYMRSKPK
jgi:hypothetical protein